MNNKTKSNIQKLTAGNDSLNRNILLMKNGFDEVYKILQREENPRKKKKH